MTGVANLRRLLGMVKEHADRPKHRVTEQQTAYCSIRVDVKQNRDERTKSGKAKTR